MDLTNKKISDTYPNVLTIGDLSNTTSGALTNGAGQPITDIVHSGNLTVDKIKYNGLVTEILTANADDISTSTILSAGLNIIDTATVSDKAVRLPQPVFGKVVNIVNTSGVDILVFPYDDQSFHFGQAAGEPFIVPADGLMYTFTCVQNPNVGVWTVLTPASGNNNSARVSVEYSQTLTSDANGGNMIIAGSVGSSPVVVSSSPYTLALGLQNPGSSLILEDAIFSNFSEIKIHSFEVLTNIPTGDLSTNLPTTAQAFGYTNPSNNQGFYNIVAELGCVAKDSVNPNSFFILMPLLEARFNELFNINYRTNNFQPLPDGSSAYIAGANDPAPFGTLALKHYSQPSNPAWFKLFDDNGFKAVYFLLRFYLGSQFLSQATSIPDQSEVKWKVRVTFDLKK